LTIGNAVRRKQTSAWWLAGDKPVTYAELLRKMQHTVKVHDIDIKIKNVRETKGGDIEITTTGKEEVKDAFIKRIQEKMGEAVTAQKVMAKKKIFIKDIHETATAEDVREELVKQATEGDKQADNIAVTMAAKPNKGRKLFAFATLPIETANKILKAGKLRRVERVQGRERECPQEVLQMPQVWSRQGELRERNQQGGQLPEVL
jgi:hypothetical protein